MGRDGQLGTVLALLLVCGAALAAAEPGWSWFQARAAHVRQREAVLRHMRDAIRHPSPPTIVPSLEPGIGAFRLPGASDAVAAAVLQQRLQAAAAAGGITLAAVEVMPTALPGASHRISLRIVFRARWTELAGFLRQVEASPLQALIDDLHLSGDGTDDAVLQASMLVLGLRSP